MKQYKTIIIYAVSGIEQKQALESELEKYGLERLGGQDIFALPLDEYRKIGRASCRERVSSPV